MLSYRHGYHAGNAADVLKHIVLIQLHQALQQKNKAYCYLDTHAGGGVYDLGSEFAQKNREHERGAAQLFNAPSGQIRHPALIDYLRVLKDFNPDSQLRFYPGSPAITKALLRPQDRMVLCDLHPSEYAALSTTYRNDPQVAVHKRDASESLKALLPPKEKRGLILIDPSYEVGREISTLHQSLLSAIKKFANGVYMIWYPILEGTNPAARIFNDPVIRSLETQDLRILFPSPAIIGRMNGSGVFLINPPWHARNALQGLTHYLQEALISGK